MQGKCEAEYKAAVSRLPEMVGGTTAAPSLEYSLPTAFHRCTLKVRNDCFFVSLEIFVHDVKPFGLVFSGSIYSVIAEDPTS